MAKSKSKGSADQVIVEYRDQAGHTVSRTFVPEHVNEENPAHEGKTHVDLANDFVEANKHRGAEIVESTEAPTESVKQAGVHAEREAKAKKSK